MEEYNILLPLPEPNRASGARDDDLDDLIFRGRAGLPATAEKAALGGLLSPLWEKTSRHRGGERGGPAPRRMCRAVLTQRLSKSGVRFVKAARRFFKPGPTKFSP